MTDKAAKNTQKQEENNFNSYTSKAKKLGSYIYSGCLPTPIMELPKQEEGRNKNN